jgi:hypothetical protein
MHRPWTEAGQGDEPNIVTATTLFNISAGSFDIVATVTKPPCEWPPRAYFWLGHARDFSINCLIISVAPMLGLDSDPIDAG